jgi:hypothetical protein
MRQTDRIDRLLETAVARALGVKMPPRKRAVRASKTAHLTRRAA